MCKQFFKKFLLITVISILGITSNIVGCTSSHVITKDDAVAYCKNNGGKVHRITDRENKDSVLCLLPDNKGCEIQAYFRGECPKPCGHTLDASSCPRYALPPPGYCQGGELLTLIDSCGCVTPPICDMNPLD